MNNGYEVKMDFMNKMRLSVMIHSTFIIAMLFDVVGVVLWNE